MALLLRSLPRTGLSAPLLPATLLSARGFATDPLQSDTRTTKPQQAAHETDEATKDSIRHAAEGDVTEAAKDVTHMAANAAKGAATSAKLMYDSVKDKVTGHAHASSEATKEDLKQGKP